jgi:hypothetical protein
MTGEMQRVIRGAIGSAALGGGIGRDEQLELAPVVVQSRAA